MKHTLQYQIIFFLVILSILSNTCSTGCPARAASKKIPAFILLTKYSKTMQIGDEFYLGAVTSNGDFPKWKSSNSRVASVNTYGLVTAKKGGRARITAKISGAEASCQVTVKKTVLTLNPRSLSLEHGETKQLNASASNGAPIQFKSRKPSVASVTDDGKISGEKPGTTYITVTADQTKATCRVTVRKPTIRLSRTKLTLRADSEYRLHAYTSSGLAVEWKSGKKSVAEIDDEGRIYANKAGTAKICARLDGVRKYCTVKVTK